MHELARAIIAAGNSFLLAAMSNDWTAASLACTPR